VTAKDKATGKENKIKIQASSGLNEAEIQRMVKDAEAHAEEDKKQLELVNARNQLEAVVHSVKKSLKDYGDKLDAGEKEKIEAAVKDAEAHAEEDRKTLELVNARNQAEATVHSVRKSMKDYGEQLDAAEKEKIEAALKDAEGVLKSEDKADIEAKAQALAQAAQKLGEKMYAAEQAKQQAAQGASAQAQPGQAEAGKKADDGNVVDAEFTEVKDKKTGS
jgi:molecular chaperone DnaK (HSP70)